MDNKNIITAGAGPAGLTAAYEILKSKNSSSFSVTVYETADAIDGIFFNYPISVKFGTFANMGLW